MSDLKDIIAAGKLDAEKDSEGRSRLFSRLEARIQPDSSEIPQSTEYVLPEYYNIVRGRLSDPVFAKYYGPTNQYLWFISPQDGNIQLGFYRWNTSEVFSRKWMRNAFCTVVEKDGLYILSLVQHPTERVEVTPVSVTEGTKPPALTPQELGLDLTVLAMETQLAEEGDD